MQRFWCNVVPPANWEKFESKKQFTQGCTNFFSIDNDDNRVFHNFPWNTPLDEATYAVCMYAHMLRQRLSGRFSFSESFQNGARSLNFRVTRTRVSKSWIAPHRDYADPTKKNEKGLYDFSRLQATLMLSEWGKDYTGDGFKFVTNQGDGIVFGQTVPIKAGDLIIWRYNNLHSVENVQPGDTGLGFLRVIHPPEVLRAAPSPKTLLGRVVRRALRRLEERSA